MTAVRVRRSGVFVLVMGALEVLGACGHPPHPGTVALTVELPSPVTLTRVSYQITGLGISEISDSIVAPEPTGTFSRFISHVPTGKGYVAKVDGHSSDGTITCEGTARFDVKVNVTTLVHVSLTCEDKGDGHVHIVVAVQCPDFRITSYSVSPLEASVGGHIEVSAATSEVDAGAVGFQWTSTVGSFEDASAAQTTYACTTPGSITLKVTALWTACYDSKTVTVTCLPADAATD